MALASKIPALAQTLELILSNDWDPTFTLRKMTACATDDSEAYCTALEEELEVKQERMTQLLREGTLTAEICHRLQARVEEDKETIRELRAANNALEERATDAERQLEAATGLLADHADRDASFNNLIKNLERENLRQAGVISALGAKIRSVQWDLQESRNHMARQSLKGCDCHADDETVVIG
jgi:chromosome segregation ATPase